MNFQFYLHNHTRPGQRTLEDPRDILAGQLAALGHKVSHGDMVVTDRINVLFEGFSATVVDRMAEAHRHGARFLIVATERPTPEGFNGGISRAMVDRQAIFPEAARYADAIWTLIPGDDTLEWYSQHAPTAYVELGYAPSLVRRVRVDPDHGFSFHGSVTDRRRTIFQKLAKRFTKRGGAVTSFADGGSRDALVSRGRIVVQVRAFDGMGSVSSSRCATALHLGRPVVAEPHELSKPWDEIVHFSKSLDAFYDDVPVKGIAWRDEHERQFARFARLLSPQMCAGRALRETFAKTALAA